MSKTVLLCLSASEHYIDSETQFFTFSCDGDTKNFDKIVGFLARSLADTGDREGIIDACSAWSAFVRLFRLPPDTNEESRRIRARDLMMPLGLIASMEQFVHPDTGKDFKAGEIGIISERDLSRKEVMKLRDISAVILVPFVAVRDAPLRGNRI